MAVSISKICTRCKNDLPLDQFSNHPTGALGKRPECRRCRAEISRISYKSDPDAGKKQKKRMLKYRYKITQDELDEMYDIQDSKCLICGKKEKVLCIDHSHDTNSVRGLLCKSCNFGLGHFNDNSELLRQAAIYLLEKEVISSGG